MKTWRKLITLMIITLPCGLSSLIALAATNNPLLLGADNYEARAEDHSIRLYFKPSSFQPLMKESRSNSSLIIKLGKPELFQTFLDFLESNKNEDSLLLMVPSQHKEKILKKSKGGVSRSEIDPEWVELKLNMEVVNLKKLLDSKAQSFDLVQWTKNFWSEAHTGRSNAGRTVIESQHSSKTLPQEQRDSPLGPIVSPSSRALPALLAP